MKAAKAKRRAQASPTSSTATTKSEVHSLPAKLSQISSSYQFD